MPCSSASRTQRPGTFIHFGVSRLSRDDDVRTGFIRAEDIVMPMHPRQVGAELDDPPNWLQDYALCDALAANPSGSAWGARFFVARDPPELVGWGGFKGPPKDGVVEVGYEIAEARRGRGLATAATRAMLAEAFADERVTAVIAHTLRERNASNRVLEKAGFRFEGEAQEDEEVVWRFSLTRPASGA